MKVTDENVLLTLTEKKMGGVCISEDGKENGKLVGIITGDIRRALLQKKEVSSLGLGIL